MKRIIIIEDEQVIARNLKNLITRADEKMEVIAILSSVQDSIDWLSRNELPDIIFSDIQLSDGISFEIFEKTPVKCPVIFVTAYDQYAIRAFKVNGIDYLMKPVSLDEVKHALDKYARLTGAGIDQHANLKNMLTTIGKKDQPDYKTRFLAHYMNGMIPVSTEHIAGFKKDQLIYIVTRDGKELVTDYHSLDELEELVDPVIFFRANRQHIVHIDDVRNFKISFNGKIIVQLNNPTLSQIEISREKAAAFKHWIG